MKLSTLFLIFIFLFFTGCVSRKVNKNDFYFNVVYKSFKDVLAYELELSSKHLSKNGIEVSQVKDKQEYQKILDNSYTELLNIMENTKSEYIAKNITDYLRLNTHFFQELGKLTYKNNKKLILLVCNDVNVNEVLLYDLTNINSKFYPYFEERVKFYLAGEKF